VKNSLKEIRNIIFDLGGVIINLDMERTHQALLQLAGKAEVPLFNYTTQHEIFKRFEVGHMDSQAFLNGLGELVGNATHEELTLAWNAMLLDIPAERIALLKQLKEQYRTFLFSNTNQIHYEGFNQILLEDHGLPGLEPLFERVYFSHTMGMRKPDVESFKRIITENGLIPEETLFLDDTAGHLEGAKAAGLQTILVSSENHLLEIFGKLAHT
jgi:putative hydrolase of the HAD superfamily